MPHTYKAVQNPNKTFAIVKDDIPCTCPKTVWPNPVQLRTGGMQIQLMRFGCTTECPFAELKKIKDLVQGTPQESEEYDAYVISCAGGREKIIRVDQIVPHEEKSNPNPGSVIHMP